MSSKERTPPSRPALIVENNQKAADELTEALRDDMSCVSTTSTQQALDHLQNADFSVILCGLSPSPETLLFLSESHKMKPETQRILLINFSDIVSASQIINKAKITMLLTKPFDREDLKRTVSDAVLLNRKLCENSELRKLALTDALTGISNHRYFWERLDAELSRAQRYQRPLSVIMCDIDNFKHYNEQYGHLRGDEVLRLVAQTLEHGRRSMDTVARYGGEEFSIILPEVNKIQAMEIAKRHFETVLFETNISMSFGVSTFPENAQTSTELVHCADLALLKAKNQGKGQVVSAANN